MLHLDEETIAQHAAGLLAGEERITAESHLASCPVCRGTAGSYGALVASLTLPSVPAGVLERIREQLAQRTRVRAFVQRLIEDPAWRVDVQRDPYAALERHRIQPTPQLVAALKQITSLQEDVDASQLDERISKLLPPI